jgi:hypothetical protein
MRSLWCRALVRWLAAYEVSATWRCRHIFVGHPSRARYNSLDGDARSMDEKAKDNLSRRAFLGRAAAAGIGAAALSVQTRAEAM